MNRIPVLVGAVILSATIVESPTKITGVPKAAVVLETMNLKTASRPNRNLDHSID